MALYNLIVLMCH